MKKIKFLQYKKSYTKILITLLFLVGSIVQSHAQLFWEHSGNRNDDCISSFIDKGLCNESEKVLSGSIDDGQGLIANYNIYYTELNCQGNIIITFHGVADVEIIQNSNMMQGDAISACFDSGFIKILLMYGANSMYSNVLFAKSATCFAPVEVFTGADSCLQSNDNGGTYMYIQPSSHYYFPLECTGGACCAAMATIDLGGQVIFTTPLAGTVEDCGRPDSTYMKYVLAQDRCKSKTFRIAGIGKCQASNCDINFEGIYQHANNIPRKLAKANATANDLNHIVVKKIDNNHISLDFNGEARSITILDIHGKSVKSLSTIENISIEDLSKGLYFVHANFGKLVKTAKFIKD